MSFMDVPDCKMVKGHRDAFQEYLQEKFIQRKNEGSKTVTRSKRDLLVKTLILDSG